MAQSTLSLSGLTMLLSITQQLRCQPQPGHQNASPSLLASQNVVSTMGGGVKVSTDTGGHRVFTVNTALGQVLLLQICICITMCRLQTQRRSSFFYPIIEGLCCYKICL